MDCPTCGYHRPYRVARRGWIAAVQHQLGRYPYHCPACERNFFSPNPNPPKPPEPPPPDPQPGPSMASRKSPQEPTAAIVVKAESNEQLSNILLALAQAVEREQHPQSHRTR